MFLVGDKIQSLFQPLLKLTKTGECTYLCNSAAQSMHIFSHRNVSCSRRATLAVAIVLTGLLSVIVYWSASCFIFRDFSSRSRFFVPSVQGPGPISPVHESASGSFTWVDDRLIRMSDGRVCLLFYPQTLKSMFSSLT